MAEGNPAGVSCVQCHGLNVGMEFRLVNADVNGAEKEEKASRGVELLKEDERADEHQRGSWKDPSCRRSKRLSPRHRRQRR